MGWRLTIDHKQRILVSMKQTTFDQLAVGSVFWFSQLSSNDCMLEKRKVSDSEYAYVIDVATRPENQNWKFQERPDGIVYIH